MNYQGIYNLGNWYRLINSILIDTFLNRLGIWISRLAGPGFIPLHMESSQNEFSLYLIFVDEDQYT